MRMNGHGSTLLCLNCLELGAVPVPVGNEKGSQRDPYREVLPLCGPCRDSLIEGNLGMFHARHRVERSVIREQLDELAVSKDGRDAE
jgi:hypothetical protein